MVDRQSCKPMPVLPYDGFNVPVEVTDCDAYKTSRKLYDEIAPKVVLIEAADIPPKHADRNDLKVGSGFFVGDGDEVVTNTHVAAAGSYVNVKTQDGRRFAARIEKLDDTNDLALLKIEGIGKDPKRSIARGSSVSLAREQDLVAYSHPMGLEEVYASPGYFRHRGSLNSMLLDLNQFRDLKSILHSVDSTNPVEATAATNYMNADRLRLRINIMHSSSGSPLVDTTGSLVGVTANRVTQAQGLFIPVEKVEEMISKPESRFIFRYQADGDDYKLLGIERTDGSKIPPMNLVFDKEEKNK